MNDWLNNLLARWDAQEAMVWLGPAATLLTLALILLAAWLLSRFSRGILTRLVGLTKRNRRLAVDERKADTLLTVGVHILRVLIWFVAVVTVLYRLGLGGTVGSLLATAGIGGIALGLGAQSLVRDYIGGFFLILDGRLAVGDFVTLGGVTGTVESLNLRTTQIRGFRGDLTTIPNGDIAQVTNMSRGAYLAVVDMSVAYEADLDRAVAVMEEEAARWADENPEAVTEAPQVLGPVSFGESDVVLRALLRSAAPSHYAVERELRRRFKLRFDAEGIEIPYPRRVVVTRKEPEETP